jgi:hypothetical protein
MLNCINMTSMTLGFEIINDTIGRELLREIHGINDAGIRIISA